MIILCKLHPYLNCECTVLKKKGRKKVKQVL